MDRGLSTLHPGLDQCHQVRGTSAAGTLDPGSVIDGIIRSSSAAELTLTDVGRSDTTLALRVEDGCEKLLELSQYLC